MEKFPLCFIAEGEAKPLKIGLFQDLAEALKDDEHVSKTQLRQAFTSIHQQGCRINPHAQHLRGSRVNSASWRCIDVKPDAIAFC